MKVFVVLFAAIALVAAETFSPENDDMDIDKIVANADKFKAIVSCFNNASPCDPVGAAAKQDLAEAIKGQCDKCTDAQKYQLKVVLKALEGYAAEKEAFAKIYDPENKYISALQAKLANVNKP